MTGKDLKSAREKRGWTQLEAAKHLAVSQTYLSLLENGKRQAPGKLAMKLLRNYAVSPTVLPLETRPNANLGVDAWTRSLGVLGYPEYSYLKGRPDRNPAEVLLTALGQPNLDTRVAKGLPWLALHYPDMNWEWLVNNAKVRDLQNRLGFVVTLARQVAERNAADKAPLLAKYETQLNRSRLVQEDTFCHDSLTKAEKRWLRQTRSPEAQHWNLLTDLTAQQLAYAD